MRLQTSSPQEELALDFTLNHPHPGICTQRLGGGGGGGRREKEHLITPLSICPLFSLPPTTATSGEPLPITLPLWAPFDQSDHLLPSCNAFWEFVKSSPLRTGPHFCSFSLITYSWVGGACAIGVFDPWLWLVKCECISAEVGGGSVGCYEISLPLAVPAHSSQVHPAREDGQHRRVRCRGTKHRRS